MSARNRSSATGKGSRRRNSLAVTPSIARTWRPKLCGDEYSRRKATSATLTPGEVKQIAKTLNVKESDVVEMESRLTGADIPLEPTIDDGEESYAPIAYLADSGETPAEVLERFDDAASGGSACVARDRLSTAQSISSFIRTAGRGGRGVVNCIRGRACPRGHPVGDFITIQAQHSPQNPHVSR